MLFNSTEFLIFFPIAVLGYYILPHKFRYIWLLLCSYYFYMCWNPKYILLLVTSTFFTYITSIFIEAINNSTSNNKDKSKKLCIAICFFINISILGYFKYYNFFISNLAFLLNKFRIYIKFPTCDFLLPVGISFYTFQALGYIVDVYRGEIKAEKNPFKYALFVSFFPQLVAGPIERSKNLLRQFNERHYFNFAKARDGLCLIIWGLFLKLVLADRISIFVDTVFSDIDTYTGWYLIIASILFSIQIYCDFAGYSIIAMGSAEILGFDLTDNFNAPYFSKSIAEFWRRWHISLFSWFHDYIYIPLGGNRKGKIRKYINIMIVFFISGLWHGAAWHFIVWGGLNGLYQIIGSILNPIRNKMNNLLHMNQTSFSHKLYQTIMTFILIDITWIFFRASSLNEALKILHGILNSKNIWILFDGSLYKAGLNENNFRLMITSIIVFMLSDYYKRKGISIRSKICQQELWFRWLALAGGILFILVFGIWGSGYDPASFIYFQF